MTATFLVEVEVNSLNQESLELDAEDILDVLDLGDYNVFSVKPWAHQDAPVQPVEHSTANPELAGSLAKTNT